jgi:hypothetical protein
MLHCVNAEMRGSESVLSQHHHSLILGAEAPVNEGSDLVPGNQVDAVIEADVPSAGNDEQLLGSAARRNASSLNSLECATSPVMKSIGRGDIVSMSENG